MKCCDSDCNEVKVKVEVKVEVEVEVKVKVEGVLVQMEISSWKLVLIWLCIKKGENMATTRSIRRKRSLKGGIRKTMATRR